MHVWIKGYAINAFGDAADELQSFRASEVVQHWPSGDGASWVKMRDGAMFAVKPRDIVEIEAPAATILADNTGWRGVFSDGGEKGAWVELLPLLGWRTFSDGRPAAPVFAVDTDGEKPIGFVDADGDIVPLRADRRRVGKKIGFAEWLHGFMMRYYTRFPIKKPQYVFDLNPDAGDDLLDEMPHLRAENPADEAAIQADIALGLARLGLKAAA